MRRYKRGMAPSSIRKQIGVATSSLIRLLVLVASSSGVQVHWAKQSQGYIQSPQTHNPDCRVKGPAVDDRVL